MKPFDLEAALAGAPVVTRFGEPIEAIAHLGYGIEADYPVIAMENGTSHLYTRKGEHCRGIPHEFDLFMAEGEEV